MGKELHILTVFYGKRYSSYFSEITMPSLLKSLSGLQKELPVTHYIYCTKMDNPDTTLCDKEWSKTVVNKKLIRVASPKEDLYKAVMRQILISSEKEAAIIFAQNDFVYGHGMRKLVEDHYDDFVVCPHARCRISAIKEIKEFVEGNYDNKQFARFNYKQVQHAMVDYGLAHESEYWRAKDFGSYYEVFFKEPVPILFKADIEIYNIMKKKESQGASLTSPWGIFETIDHEWVDHFFQNGKLYYPKTSEEFMWMELTQDTVYNPTVFQPGFERCHWSKSMEFFDKASYKVIFE